jgi:hypothetical protein
MTLLNIMTAAFIALLGLSAVSGVTFHNRIQRPSCWSAPCWSFTSPAIQLASIQYECAAWHDMTTTHQSAAAKVPCQGKCMATWKKCAGTGIAAQRACCSAKDVCVYKDATYSQCRPKSKPLPKEWKNAKVITCTRALFMPNAVRDSMARLAICSQASNAQRCL